MAFALSGSDFVLTASAAPFVFAPNPGELSIMGCTVTNTDTVSHTITLYRVAAGASPATSNIIAASALPIPAGGTVALPLAGQNLTNGQTLQGLASTASVVNINTSWIVPE